MGTQRYWFNGEPFDGIGQAPGTQKHWEKGKPSSFYIPAGGASPQNISPAGIDVGIQLGTPSMGQPQTISPTGIDNTVVFGTPSIGIAIYPSGIDNTIVLGTPTIQLAPKIYPTGIASIIVLGTPSIKGPRQLLLPVGIGGVAGLIKTGTPAIGAPAILSLYIREIGGSFVNRTEFLNVASFSYEKKVSEKSSCDFTLDVQDGSYRPAEGVELFVNDGIRRAFAGFITDVREFFHPGTSCYHYECKCVDYNAILEHRYVMRKYPYPHTVLTRVVEDIANTILVEEGVEIYEIFSLGLIPDEEFGFDLVSVADALKRCSEIGNDVFWIDYFKKFHYIPALVDQQVVAPMEITEDGEDAADIEISRTTSGLRTVQYIRSDVNILSEPREESFTALGSWPEDSMFVTKFPIVGKPLVYVNDAPMEVRELFEDTTGMGNGFRYLEGGYGVFTYPQGFYKAPPTLQEFNGNPLSNDYPLWCPVTTLDSVYRNGVPDLANWSFVPGVAQVTWIGGGALAESDYIRVTYTHPITNIPSYLAAGNVVKVKYDAQASNIIVVSDAAAIADQAARDGGSGKWEEVAEQRINSVAEGEAYASGLITLKKAPVTTITYNTVKAGIDAGQKLRVRLPRKGVPDSWFLVDQVSRKSEGVDLGDGSTFRTDVTLTSTRKNDWRGVFGEIRDRTRRTVPPQYEKATFWLAISGGDPGIGLEVGNNVTNAPIMKRRGLLSHVSVIFTTPPVGASIILRIKKNGVTIMDAENIQYPPGAALVRLYSNFNSAVRKVSVDDILTLDVLQTGTTTKGANGTVVVYAERTT